MIKESYSFGNVEKSRLRRAVMADFNSWAEEFVKKKGKELGREILWWNIDGNQKELQGQPQYQKYKVTLNVENLIYRSTSSEIEMPVLVETNWYPNEMSDSTDISIHKEIRHQSDFQFIITQGLKTKNKVIVRTEIPSSISGENNSQKSVTLDIGGTGFHEREIDVFKIEHNFNLEPQTKVKVDFVVWEREVEIPFEIKIRFTGFVAVGYRTTHKNWIWFHRTSEMQNELFRSEGDALIYTVKGVFRGKRGIRSEIQTEEFPL